MSNAIGHRIVSTFAGTEQVLRWKVQKLAEDDSEAKWRDCVFKGFNFYTTSAEAVAKMNQLTENK